MLLGVTELHVFSAWVFSKDWFFSVSFTHMEARRDAHLSHHLLLSPSLTHTHMRAHTHTHTHTHIFSLLCSCLLFQVHSHTCTHTHTHTHTLMPLSVSLIQGVSSLLKKFGMFWNFLANVSFWDEKWANVFNLIFYASPSSPFRLSKELRRHLFDSLSFHLKLCRKVSLGEMSGLQKQKDLNLWAQIWLFFIYLRRMFHSSTRAPVWLIDY